MIANMRSRLVPPPKPSKKSASPSSCRQPVISNRVIMAHKIATDGGRIKEVNFGEWEMKSWNELSSDPRSEAWFKDWVNNPTPNGESLQDQYDRVSDFLNELRKSELQKVCLFAHGGVLTCARVYAGEYPLQDAFKNVPSYGAIVKLVLD